MEKLVEVSEQEVQIDFKLGCKCRVKIHLKSLSKSNPIAFKVQTSAPHKFLVSPPNGLILPSSSTSFQVILKPQTQLPASFPRSPSERFLVKTALAPGLEDDGRSVSSWFSSTSRVTSDIKLKVAYLGTFLLHQAVAKDDIEAVKNIVKRKKPALASLSPHETLSLLEAASFTTNPDILHLLLESGLKQVHMCAPVPSHVTNPTSSVQVPESELEAKEELDMMVSKGWSQLHLAAAAGQHEILQRLIMEAASEGSLDCRDRLGRTPLHLAASKGHTLCAELLIDAGADKNAKGGDGRTALFKAAANGEAEMVALLLEMGADPTITADDIHGFTPLDVAREKGHKQVVEILESGELLLTAARRGDLNTLKSLLDKCPRLNRFDQYGLTALHSAAIKGHTGAVDMLAEHGMDLECQDCEGHTPLHLAVESGCLETVEVLIDRGANVNARSKRGASPLYLATSMGHDMISQLLRNRGAGPECSLSSSSSLSSCSFS